MAARDISGKVQKGHPSPLEGAIAWYCVLAIGGFFGLNWIYQVIRKPGELFAPISASLSKSPETTWQSYGSLFEKHSTNIISPEFLAALAQVEGAAAPSLARTGAGSGHGTLSTFIVRQSALGMFQITDGTFAEARFASGIIRSCSMVRGTTYVPAGSTASIRTIPSHSIEMTAAHLHRSVVDTLAAHRTPKVSLTQQQELAAVIHLCGLKRGETFVIRASKQRRANVAGLTACNGISIRSI